jgi:hypothetical protein
MEKCEADIKDPEDWSDMKTQRRMNIPKLYEIRVEDHLSETWSTYFEGLSIQHEPEGETVLSGILDQAALHGVLVKIRNLNLILISVNRVGATGPSCLYARDECLHLKGE